MCDSSNKEIERKKIWFSFFGLEQGLIGEVPGMARDGDERDSSVW